jgi:hypothetical protein
MNKFSFIEKITIVIITIFLLYGSYFILFAKELKSGKVLIFMSLISILFMIIKKRIKI